MSIQSPKSALPIHINLIWLRCCALVKLPIHEDGVVFVLAWPQVQDRQRLIQKKKKKKEQHSCKAWLCRIALSKIHKRF